MGFQAIGSRELEALASVCDFAPILQTAEGTDRRHVRANRLARGAKVRLLPTGETVTLKPVNLGPFWEFLYETSGGVLGQLTVPKGDVPCLRVVDEPDRIPFDGDPALFRLGVEAHRIRAAFTHDYAVLAVSTIQTLAHQLDAVNDAFLSQPRLRSLLADDPGAGKTIMAGWYLKELDLRRSADRVLVVTPANLRPQWAQWEFAA
jgi:hypothetical protein